MIAAISYWRPAHQCTPVSILRGAAYVFPANIQDSQISGFCAAQIGWGQADSATSNAWYITPDDMSCALSQVAVWPAPVVGHSYKFTVTGDLTGYWRYLLRDNTVGTTYQVVLATRHTTAGDNIWSGFEVFKNEDQYGGAGTSGAVSIRDIGYYNSSGTLFYLTPGNSTFTACCGTRQSYWHTTETVDGDGQD